MRNPQKKKMESIYKVARTVKRRERSLYNALRSIHHDYSMFIREIALLWPELALLANLRCGLWYAPQFDGVCYFKSTDGHNGNWSFSATRLNLHVAFLAGDRKKQLWKPASRFSELADACIMRVSCERWMHHCRCNKEWETLS